MQETGSSKSSRRSGNALSEAVLCKANEVSRSVAPEAQRRLPAGNNLDDEWTGMSAVRK